MRLLRRFWLASLLLFAVSAGGQGRAFLFVEPDPDAPEGALPAYRPLQDRVHIEQLQGWSNNEAALFAVEAYRLARLAAGPAVAPEELVVVVEAEEATTDCGLRLRRGNGWETWPNAPYLRLGDEAWRFSTVLLHETGHACLILTAGGRPLPGRAIAPIPHALPALTDRTTAFQEGFAVALEAVLAQRATTPALRSLFHHDELLFGVMSRMQGEYFRPSAQLASYAQQQGRFQDVRDNMFAFAPAHRHPDYLRTQLDPARDFAVLRDANQLMQSEGFAAAVFYALLMRGRTPDAETLRSRLAALLQAMRDTLRTTDLGPDTPLLIEVVVTLAQQHPQQRREILAVLLDHSRGVLVDPAAATLWRQHYEAVLRQHLHTADVDTLNAARERWLEAALANPAVLRSRLGPQIPCTVEAVTISLPALGVQAPLCFDLNTAEEGTVRAIPGISDAEVAQWLRERERAPFASVADFRARVPLRSEVAGLLRL